MTKNRVTPEVTNFALVRQVRERVAAKLAERRKDDDVAGRLALTQEARQAFAAELIDEDLSALAKERIEAGQPRLHLDAEEALAQAVYDALFAAAGLQRLLEDESITDIHAEGFMVCIENEIADAAHQLARLCLDAGDAKGARWAARQGLRASAGNEQLYRDAMEAADLEGNRAGVEALMNELAHVIEEDCPLENLHPETVALYNELTSGERAARLARTAP
ncbi:MAG: hypothetical protein JO086_11735 [Acidimicrobiia bacterium]|nr:hypothetical protein [Acidimicrobiia bacterium]